MLKAVIKLCRDIQETTCSPESLNSLHSYSTCSAHSMHSLFIVLPAIIGAYAQDITDGTVSLTIPTTTSRAKASDMVSASPILCPYKVDYGA